jgi:hypothetical protein
MLFSIVRLFWLGFAEEKQGFRYFLVVSFRGSGVRFKFWICCGIN